MANVVEHRKFSCTNLGNNNNKFWNVTLYDNGDVRSEFGRQGDSGQTKVWPGAGRSHMESKIHEKEKKGYHENQVIEGVGTTTVSAKTVADTDLKNIAAKQIKSSNPVVAQLVDFLVKVNAHNILQATNGKITYDTNSATFKTTQGVVIPDQVAKARNLLKDLADGVANGRWSDYEFEEALNEYLSLIPRDIGRRRVSPSAMLPDLQAIQKETDILDGLEASFVGLQTVKPTKKTKTKDTPQLFDVEMEIITDNSIISHVKNLYQSTRKAMHQANNLSVQTVYKIEIKNMKQAFDKYGAKLADIRQLWHGTKASNLLSIMKQGLIIPPLSSGHCTGRLYGNGVYFSSISTKALNYATNYWGSGGSTDRTFMFLSDVAMGKYYLAKSTCEQYPKMGYDSTWAKGGVASVVNDEMIVYRLDQCNLVYLVEFVARTNY